MKLRRTRNGRTDYSEEVPGEKGNYGRSVGFDLTGSYVGISQGDGEMVTDRVLLSPQQVRALLAFIGARS